VIGERLKQARELNGFTQEQLAELIDVKQGAIAQIERDALTPRDELLDAIATATGFPREFFDLPIVKDFPLGSLTYRKFARMKAEHKKLSHRLAQQAFELSEFLAAQLKPINVGLPRGMETDPISAARLVRNALGLDETSPAKNLIHKLERIGVRMFTLPEDIPDLDAFSIWVQGRTPVVVLNPHRPGDRQLFSVAHEVGHLALHYPLTTGQDGIEVESNKFASELLLPAEAMQAELISPVTLTLLADLKTRWRVSIAALLQRAKDLNVVTERQYRYLRMQMGDRGWIKHEPVEIEPDRPQGLRRMAEVAYGGTLNVRRIARDTRRPPFLVARLLDANGSGGDLGRVLDFRGDQKSEVLA